VGAFDIPLNFPSGLNLVCDTGVPATGYFQYMLQIR